MVVSLRANLFSGGLGGAFAQRSQPVNSLRIGGDEATTLATYSSVRKPEREEQLGFRSINDSISLVNVAEGALDEIASILERQQELAELGSDEILSDTVRAAIESENSNLQAEYTRILEETEYNGTRVFSGELGSVSVQAGEQTLRLNFSFSLPEQSSTSLASATSSASALTTLESLEEEINVSRVQAKSSGAQIGSFIEGVRVSQRNDIEEDEVLSDLSAAEELAAVGAETIVSDPELALAAQANIQADIVLASLGEEDEYSSPGINT